MIYYYITCNKHTISHVGVGNGFVCIDSTDVPVKLAKELLLVKCMAHTFASSIWNGIYTLHTSIILFGLGPCGSDRACVGQGSIEELSRLEPLQYSLTINTIKS